MKPIIVKLAAGCMYAALIALGFSSCQKMERPEMVLIPDDTARINGPLQLYVPFEDSPDDSAQYQSGTATNVTYTDGIRGRAYQGASNAQLQFPLTQRMAELESFTISFWMNTQKHTGGAQSVFVMPNTDDFWGNIFAIIEGNDSETDNSMEFKFNFAGNWIEFAGRNGLERLPDMYGDWKHLVFSYNGNTSVFSAYLNGQKMDLPDAVSNRVADGNPLGPLSLSNTSRFVIGAFQQHIGISGSEDSWMHRFTGALDQFRVYITPLTDEQVTELYESRM